MTRKNRMGIVTNKMSDEVYNHLDKKAQANELSQYIIKLVETDLHNVYLKDQLGIMNSELKNVFDTIDKMKNVFQSNEPIKQMASDESLVNLNLVSDDKVDSKGFEESVDMDF